MWCHRDLIPAEFQQCQAERGRIELKARDVCIVSFRPARATNKGSLKKKKKPLNIQSS